MATPRARIEGGFMKFWIGVLVVMLLACHAQAEELQFDLTGTAFTQDNGFYPGVGPFAISFVLDTSASTFVPVFGSACLQQFSGNAALLNFSATVNGSLVESAPSLTAPYNGIMSDHGACTGLFIAGIDVPGFLWAIDPGLRISQSAITTSADPLATLFENFQSAPGYGELGNLNLSITTLTVMSVSVPEPDILALWALGVIGLIGIRRLTK
jgi:hypothetical protein